MLRLQTLNRNRARYSNNTARKKPESKIRNSDPPKWYKGTINAARENEALKAEADFRQAVENGHAVENAVLEYINASPDGSKHINYNRLTGVPLHLEGDLIRTSQITLKARDAYLDTHPEERNNPMLPVHIGEDGFVKYGSELQQQSAIASPDESRAMPLDGLRNLCNARKMEKCKAPTGPRSLLWMNLMVRSM